MTAGIYQSLLNSFSKKNKDHEKKGYSDHDCTGIIQYSGKPFFMDMVINECSYFLCDSN